jgi:hypothetical protein
VRAILTLVSTIACAVLLFAAGLAIAAYATRDYEPHHFAHMETPDLWTSRPTAVDPARRDYERVEGVQVVAYVAPTDGDVDTASLARSEERDVKTREVAENAAEVAQPIDSAATGTAQLDAGHVDWCLARYRSYQVEDNSYQPYGGGPRQECVSPAMDTASIQPAADLFAADGRKPERDIAVASSVVMPSQEQQTANMGSMSTTTHEAWCHERYRSYRSEDNSYQPLDGGPRRACMSPYG